jgi:hypothetical protein
MMKKGQYGFLGEREGALERKRLSFLFRRGLWRKKMILSFYQNK